MGMDMGMGTSPYTVRHVGVRGYRESALASTFIVLGLPLFVSDRYLREEQHLELPNMLLFQVLDLFWFTMSPRIVITDTGHTFDYTL